MQMMTKKSVTRFDDSKNNNCNIQAINSSSKWKILLKMIHKIISYNRRSTNFLVDKAK